MTLTPFSAPGLLLATGPGILLLALLATSLVLIWDWRWALPGAMLVSLGLSSIQATLHGPAPLVTLSQWLAVIVASVLLGLAGRFHPAAARLHTNSNWLTRLIALLFVLGAWWVIDPGVSLPLFTQVETDLILWTGLCGLLLISLSAAPLHTGIGLLLLITPLQAIAAILLPGAGLTVVAGIAQILVGLGCAYLTLTQQIPQRTQRLVAPLPTVTTQAPSPTAQSPSRVRRGLLRLRRQTPAGSMLASADDSGQEAHTPVEKNA